MIRYFVFAVLCANVLNVGCAPLSRERNNAVQDNVGGRAPNQPFWQGSGEPPESNREFPSSLQKTVKSGILEGDVYDETGHDIIRGRTTIRVRLADSESGSRGLTVDTDDQGHFMIPDLQYSKTYELEAAREQFGTQLAGGVQVRPPHRNIKLMLSKKAVSSVSPLPPPPIGYDSPFRTNDKLFGDDNAKATPQPPSRQELPPLPPPPRRPENIAEVAGVIPPTLNIRGAPAPVTRTETDLPAPPVSATELTKEITDLQLVDPLGRSWSFRKSESRLILLEFWSTSCVPCQKAVPGMKKIQSDFGNSGLEVVALALEPGDRFKDRAQTVDEYARYQQLNYRVYLEPDGSEGKVRDQFQVKYVPTLILLNRKGNVLWRGSASNQDLTNVRRVIQDYLTQR
ncbi:MAG: thioredoxin-like domain-containing protein [Zavarzinella sp.]